MMRERLSLALMSSQMSWGGGEQFLWSLGTGMSERGHHVLWIAPEESVLHARAKHADFHRFAIRRRPSPVNMLKLRRSIAEHGVQVLHLNDSHAITWGALSTIARCHLPRVAVKHNVFPIRSSAKYNWFVERLVCVSEAAKSICIEGGILERKLQVIPGGVTTRSIDRRDQNRRLKIQLELDTDRVLLVAVGSLIPCKGYLSLLHAVQNAIRSQPGIFLAICGEGDQRTELQKQIVRMGLEQHVRLMGFQDDIDGWIGGADLFVHSALSEGLSLVTIQAQMLGTPAVVTDVGGLSEVMRCPMTGQHLGWLCEANHPSQMAKTILQAIEDSSHSQNMVEMARRMALRRYSMDGMLTRYELSYLDLVSTFRNRVHQAA